MVLENAQNVVLLLLELMDAIELNALVVIFIYVLNALKIICFFIQIIMIVISI